MVSFQCDGCTDVVKKPKLDRHYGQCRSSFTCIDCSATFAGPVEWKVHTSCITEAEKYQKSVYKGSKKGQDTRPSNGHQNNTQLKTVNATGKYHQSRSNQQSWSRHQHIRTYASGANDTPLGSPLRMSPVDTSAVNLPLSGENAVTKTEGGESKKRDSEKHTPNGMEPKEKKKRKKYDAPGEHGGKDVRPNETTHVAPEQPQEASKEKAYSEGHRRSEKSGDNSQPPTDGISETSGNKKVKKRRKEKGVESRLTQGDVSKETITPPEPVPLSVDDGTKDEKKVKKRKHKEKREDAEANHGGTAPTKERLVSQTGDSKGDRKKRKAKDEKATGEKRKHEDFANDVERKRRKRDR